MEETKKNLARPKRMVADMKLAAYHTSPAWGETRPCWGKLERRESVGSAIKSGGAD